MTPVSRERSDASEFLGLIYACPLSEGHIIGGYHYFTRVMMTETPRLSP
jgi:hypothetical protein